MSSQQKRGFRLPWGAERASDTETMDADTLDTASPDPTSGVDSDDLGGWPFRPAGASPMPTTEEAPASSDVPEDTAEAAMIDTQAQSQSVPEAEGGGWPDVDRRTAPSSDEDPVAVRPPIHVANGERPARRDNPLVAGLVKAMREAAIASRDETLSRLQADAEARVEGIRTRATTEAAELRKRAEGDITEIREWSKNEIARVRQQTEDRIEARKAELAGETERHAGSVEQLVANVKSVVGTFQDDMQQFFERLLSEDDPARLAALAEQAPDAPDMSGEGPAAIDMVVETAPHGPEAEAAHEFQEEASAPDGPEEALGSDGLEAEAAAAAEVAASEGLDMGESNEWPAAALAAVPAEEPAPDATEHDDGATRLLVSGLGSVAGISALKGALGQLPGVHAVSVSSGERGNFVFAVTHDPGIDLASGVTGLPGFEARIMDATDDGITVVAHEPAA